MKFIVYPLKRNLPKEERNRGNSRLKVAQTHNRVEKGGRGKERLLIKSVSGGRALRTLSQFARKLCKVFFKNKLICIFKIHTK